MPSERETRFRKALEEMALQFEVELTEQRALLYWETCRDVIEPDEWEYACLEARRRETFYKLPLPAHLMDYVREYRRQRRQEVLLEQVEERTTSRHLLHALRPERKAAREAERLVNGAFPGYRTDGQDVPRRRG